MEENAKKVDYHRIANITKEMVFSEIELKFDDWKNNLQ